MIPSAAPAPDAAPAHPPSAPDEHDLCSASTPALSRPEPRQGKCRTDAYVEAKPCGPPATTPGYSMSVVGNLRLGHWGELSAQSERETVRIRGPVAQRSEQGTFKHFGLNAVAPCVEGRAYRAELSSVSSRESRSWRPLHSGPPHLPVRQQPEGRYAETLTGDLMSDWSAIRWRGSDTLLARRWQAQTEPRLVGTAAGG